MSEAVAASNVTGVQGPRLLRPRRPLHVDVGLLHGGDRPGPGLLHAACCSTCTPLHGVVGACHSGNRPVLPRTVKKGTVAQGPTVNGAASPRVEPTACRSPSPPLRGSAPQVPQLCHAQLCHAQLRRRRRVPWLAEAWRRFRRIARTPSRTIQSTATQKCERLRLRPHADCDSRGSEGRWASEAAARNLCCRSERLLMGTEPRLKNSGVRVHTQHDRSFLRPADARADADANVVTSGRALRSHRKRLKARNHWRCPHEGVLLADVFMRTPNIAPAPCPCMLGCLGPALAHFPHHYGTNTALGHAALRWLGSAKFSLMHSTCGHGAR
eukprot:365262-Chlamydomonas_euryale.AAC.6